MNVIPKIAEFHDDLTAWRRDIHAHPELGFEEQRTSDLVAEKLAEFGCEVHRGLAKTGVVGTLRAGQGNRAIALRADMDALPIIEANTFDHKSQHEGRMHACGHDGHTTMLLGAARYLAETRQFDGCVHFVFQPAEEGLGGGEAMVKEGLFEKFPVEAIFGIHNWPGLAVGRFAIRPGAMLAGGASWDIDVTGRGAHGALPETGIDPIVTAAQIASALQTVVSRNVKPQDTAVLSITQFHAGDAYNVIPEQARLSGTARAFSKQTLDAIEQRMTALAESIAAGFGATASIDFRRTFLPLVNDVDETGFAADCAVDLVGEEQVNREGPMIMGSEDFSFMLDACPGAYIMIGNGEGEGQGEGGCAVHNPHYDFNDEILPLGASYFSRLVERRLVSGYTGT